MKRLNKGLIRLMDYQHFVHNNKLAHLIDATVEEYEVMPYIPIPDAALDICAAGDPDTHRHHPKFSDKEDKKT